METYFFFGSKYEIFVQGSIFCFKALIKFCPKSLSDSPSLLLGLLVQMNIEYIPAGLDLIARD